MLPKYKQSYSFDIAMILNLENFAGLQISCDGLPGASITTETSSHVVVYASSQALHSNREGQQGYTSEGQEAHAGDACVLEKE